MEAEASIPATYVDLPTLISTSDVISLHVPLTAETYHLIGEEEFRMMKPTAILINMSRGPVIDEKELISALQSGRIKGAGLDVYENEPQIPLELRLLENVVLTPHLGTSTLETRIEMARMASQSILDIVEGRRPANVVNPEVISAI